MAYQNDKWMTKLRGQVHGRVIVPSYTMPEQRLMGCVDSTDAADTTDAVLARGIEEEVEEAYGYRLCRPGTL